jgi:mRNA interferase MazF
VSHRQDRGYIPDTGHIVKLDLDPRIGHEQGGWRPALILSPKSYNGKTGLAVVVPVTNQAKGYPFEVPLPSHTKTTGVILADAVRSLDWRTRKARYAETAPNEVVRAVQVRLMELLGFARA